MDYYQSEDPNEPLAFAGFINLPKIYSFEPIPENLTAEEVTRGFTEFTPWLGRCKFRDCKHISDPGCAIQHAVETGDISQERYDSYLKILASMAQDKPNHF